MQHYSLTQAQCLSEMKDRHLFTCFSTLFAHDCRTKDELREQLSAFHCSAQQCKVAIAHMAVSDHGEAMYYGPNLGLAHFEIPFEEPVFRSFFGDLNACACYFEKALLQDSGEVLEEYWTYVSALREELSERAGEGDTG